MPVQVSYPGVYIQEADSGVHAITGVATSITAFIGRAIRGPLDTPLVCNSFADMQRQFGGLWIKSRLAFAVRDFFLNGGTQAIVVRLWQKDASPESAVIVVPGGLTLAAASPGTWGNSLQVVIDHDTRDPTLGEGATTLFNLSVRDAVTGLIEVHRNVALDPLNARYLPTVLLNESSLVIVDTATSTTRPGTTTAPPPGTSPWLSAAYYISVSSASFASDGAVLSSTNFLNTAVPKKGIYALDLADLFNLLVIPPYAGADELAPNKVETTVVGDAARYCVTRRAFLLLDSPDTWQSPTLALNTIATAISTDLGTNSSNAAVFFPRLRQQNSLRSNQLETFATGGAVAGVFARTDAERGVWKAPAGLSATLVGVPALARPLTDPENGQLNPAGINCLRILPGAGAVVWGARTLQGADSLTSQWKYIPIRRFALYLEETLYRSTKWVVFEPNDAPLWGQIRLNINAFMQGLFRQGAFQGSKPSDAYFVKCDSETTTQTDINNGIVNITVGFAPLKPAEFVVITLQQLAGQAAS